MNKRYSECNDTIRLRQRDIGDIIQKSCETGCKYYMQINLPERRVWVGFDKPFESCIERLHILYYKIPTADDDINVCLGLWGRPPSHRAIEAQLRNVSHSPEPVIGPKDAYELLAYGEHTRYLEIALPTFKSKDRFIDNAFDFNESHNPVSAPPRSMYCDNLPAI